jgi:hypothetical protein
MHIQVMQNGLTFLSDVDDVSESCGLSANAFALSLYQRSRPFTAAIAHDYQSLIGTSESGVLAIPGQIST